MTRIAAVDVSLLVHKAEIPRRVVILSIFGGEADLAYDRCLLGTWRGGGYQDSGDFWAGPRGYLARISAKFRKLFLSGHVHGLDRL